MKCKRCPALTNVGCYEYPEYSCYLMDDDEIIDFKDGSCGCRRTSLKKIDNDIKKKQNHEAKSWEEYISREIERSQMYLDSMGESEQ